MEISQNFVAFSEYINFTITGIKKIDFGAKMNQAPNVQAEMPQL